MSDLLWYEKSPTAQDCFQPKPFFRIRQSKIALNQTLTLKLGVTLVLTVTQVYVFVNLRRETSTATLR